MATTADFIEYAYDAVIQSSEVGKGGVLKGIRAKIGKQAGDTIRVVIREAENE